MTKWNTKKLRALKTSSQASQKGRHAPLQMLTCYDYQTAQLLNETPLDLILVGDSLGNVILGHDTTVKVTCQDMITFGAAVKRGAKDKFVIVDMPFGSYRTFESGLQNAVEIFQGTGCEALKLEGAAPESLRIIQQAVATGIPVMGHLGLTPQSVHQMGGYYKHGKGKDAAEALKEQARALVDAGVFSLVLECVTEEVASELSRELPVPVIGIGSGKNTDGQVLVINDLLKMGKEHPPSFCQPLSDFYQLKKDLIEDYLQAQTQEATKTSPERNRAPRNNL